jgi:hypothetical protein
MKEFNDLETLKLPYVTYVRTRLEYAVPLVQYLYILELEGVHRRFLKSVLYLTEETYPQRGCPQEILLNAVGLTSLITRRTKHSVLFLFKILHGIQENISLLHQIFLSKFLGETLETVTLFIYQLLGPMSCCTLH